MAAVTSPCRVWTGEKTRGYGRMWVRSVENGPLDRHVLVHRWVMEQVHGPLPSSVHVRHRCDNPSCYRFDHLDLGSRQDNVDDMVARCRQARGERHPRAKLTERDVAEIRERLARGETMSNLGRAFDVNRTTILRIRDGKGWRL